MGLKVSNLTRWLRKFRLLFLRCIRKKRRAAAEKRELWSRDVRDDKKGEQLTETKMLVFTGQQSGNVRGYTRGEHEEMASKCMLQSESG